MPKYCWTWNFLKTWTKKFYHVKWKTEEEKHNASNEVNSHWWYSWLLFPNLDQKFQILFSNPAPPPLTMWYYSPIHYPSKKDLLRKFIDAPFPSYGVLRFDIQKGVGGAEPSALEVSVL